MNKNITLIAIIALVVIVGIIYLKPKDNLLGTKSTNPQTTTSPSQENKNSASPTFENTTNFNTDVDKDLNDIEKSLNEGDSNLDDSDLNF